MPHTQIPCEIVPSIPARVPYYQAASQIVYGYGPDGHRTSMMLTLPSGTFTYNYAYDKSGNLTSVVFPWAQTVNYQYDADSRLTQQSQLVLNSRIPFNTSITYNGMGFVSTVDNNVQGADNTFSMNYNASGNADSMVFASNADSGSIAYTYLDFNLGNSGSGLDQLILESRTGHAGYSYEYKYDKNLNRIYDSVHNWTANADNQYSQETYDASGNTTRSLTPGYYLDAFAGTTQTFGYDPEHRLITATVDGGNLQAARMAYWSNGLRASKTAQPYSPTGLVTTSYVYDGDRVVAEIFTGQTGQNAPAARLYGYGADGLAQSATINAQGNLIQYTAYTFNPQGTLVARYRSIDPLPYDYTVFDSYGKNLVRELGHSGGPSEGTLDPVIDPVGFCGQWGCYTDVETGLVLMGHRYYNPVTGRFLTRDPIGYEGGINLYAYCANNPVDRTDVEGLSVTIKYNVKAGVLVATDDDTHDHVTVTKVFSGRGSSTNNPKDEAKEDTGPIPRGTYIIDTESGKNHYGPGYSQYRLYFEGTDKNLHYDNYARKLKNGKVITRGTHNLHPGHMSLGCVTIPVDNPSGNSFDSKGFASLKTLLNSTKPFSRTNSLGQKFSYIGKLMVK